VNFTGKYFHFNLFVVATRRIGHLGDVYAHKARRRDGGTLMDVRGDQRLWLIDLMASVNRDVSRR
jgi:hypothetical protein